MSRKLFLIFTFLLSMLPLSAYCQHKKADSLRLLLQTEKEDTNRVKVLTALSELKGRIGDFDSSHALSEQAIILSRKLNFTNGTANAHNINGNIYKYEGKYAEALDNFNKAIETLGPMGDRKKIASCLINIGSVYRLQGNFPGALKIYYAALDSLKKTDDRTITANCNVNVGNVYSSQGNFPEALKHYFVSLKIYEAEGNKQAAAVVYNNLATTFTDLGNLDEALRYHLSSLKIQQELGNKSGIALSYNNIANIYSMRGNYREALINHATALKIREEINDVKGIASSHNNIGLVNVNMGDFQNAIAHYFASLRIKEQIGDKAGIIASYLNIGSLYTMMRKKSEAGTFLNDALTLSKEIGSKEDIKLAYAFLSSYDSLCGDYKSAFEHYRLYIDYRDSLINEENTKKTVQQQMQYEFDKKEAEAKAVQAKKDAIAAEEKQRQEIIFWCVGAGLAIVAGFASFIFIAYQQKRKANIEITRQKEIIEEKQKEILDSIRYAKRIQSALITSEKYIARQLRNLNKT